MKTLACALLAASACASTTDATEDDSKVVLSSKEQLGRQLFEDTRLSEPAGQSCESCHDSHHAFAGDDGSKVSGVSAGAVEGVTGSRNTPSAMYASFIPPFQFVPDDEGKLVPSGGLFWDGRASTLADQAKGPFLNPREMNNPDAATVVAKVRAAPYAQQFRDVYGAAALDDPDTAYDLVADAIAAYESTAIFHPFSSRFDDFLRGKRDLPAKAARGFALFKDPEKGNCIACHVGVEGSHEPSDWLFTDFSYDTLGVPRNCAITDNADPAHFDLGVCEQPGLVAPDGVDVGSLCGAFRVPSLRNVAVTGPYFHNGRFEKLRDVVAFYATRNTDHARWYSGAGYDDLPAMYQGNANEDEVPYDRGPGEAPRLTDAEIDEIVAFLETLTDR
ncbi:MAG TPA: cytochrome c peroxidase [Kofleriaceae bacterium]|nr:cytochrome c peroxidase [Kofleriaceae bacterium]